MKRIRWFAAIGPVLGLLAWAVLPAAAQSSLPRQLGGVAVGGLFPTGEFNDHVHQEGYGAACYYAWRLGRGPVLLGGEIDYSEYGHSRRVEYLEGIPEAGVNVDTTNDIAQGLLLLRLQPRTGRIFTFVEALAGLGYFYTETTIGDPDEDGDTMASEVNFDDFAWTAGLGAGLSVDLAKRRPAGLGGAGGGAFLELKVRYMAGGRALYLKKGSIVVVGNDYIFMPERSATSLITVQVGLTWLF